METLSATKFICLLRAIEPEELKVLDRWLRSPWCNTNKNLIRLLERVLRYYPGFSDPRFTKEKLFREVLPNGKFSDRRMNNLLSESNRKSFLRFVQKCRKLARFHADVNPKPEKLENLLKNESNIQALNWLKRKRVEVLGLKAGRSF
ncbi:MAG TPA: hypothetical protein PKE06_08415 [Flavilitoribacter sp.]|nr:hypothetical protein [Flavilitoribacter sp.]HMQ86396.1 hypothetical protein [Flavilitoribacter sp.]